MKLHCAPLSLFLCSIGAAQARVSSHNTVLEVEADPNWSLDNEIGVTIENSQNGRKCVDLSGTRISAALCSRPTRWDLRLISRSTSIYTIKVSGTDTCLGMDDNHMIMVSECNTNNLRANNQKWTYNNEQIQNTERNRCMEVESRQVKLATCSQKNKNQRFTLRSRTRRFTDVIRSVSDEPDHCMRAHDSDIESAQCRQSTSWDINPNTGEFKYNGSSMCLDASNGVDEAATINKCDDSNSQKWEQLSNPNRIRSDFTKQCLKLNDTTKLFNLRTCGTGEPFQFTYGTKPTRTTSTERIISVSDKTQCMRAQDSDIESARCRQSTSWDINPNTGEFKYNGSSMCLDASNGVDGAATINKCDDSNSQKWVKESNPNRIRSDFTKQCLKLNDTTKLFNLRTCGTGEPFQFTYEKVNDIEVTNME